MKCLCHAALTQKETKTEDFVGFSKQKQKITWFYFLCFSEKNLDDEETKLEQKTNRGRVQTMPAAMKEERI